MTKREIVLSISEETNLKQTDVKKVTQAILDKIILALKQGEKVELRNFGIFRMRQRRGRKGRNPRTGQEVLVPPKKIVTFKPGLLMRGL